ncbi:MAG: thiamine phosphate synthase [Desulfobacterales bacterium]
MNRPTPREIFRRTRARIYCFADTPALCRLLLDAGARVIQLRHKTAPDDEFRDLAREMLKQVRACEGALLIVNDRVEIALSIGADGVHVGQEDLDAREVVRRAPPGMLVGVSARTPEEARRAEAAGAAYIGAGSVFPTGTKRDAKVIGLEGLRRVVEAVSLPVVAIGGITEASVREVFAAGARFCAVISAVNQAPDPAAALRRLLAACEKFPGGKRQ